MNSKEKIEKIMAELEKNMENKKDYEYVRDVFSKLISDFLKDTEKPLEDSETKLSELEEKQKDLEQKCTQMEEMLEKIQKDFYINDDYDFEIVCPYCNFEFEAELDGLKTEIRCPECNNVIELDWNEEECGGECSGCHGCEPEEELEQKDVTEPNKDEEDTNSSEDDM